MAAQATTNHRNDTPAELTTPSPEASLKDVASSANKPKSEPRSSIDQVKAIAAKLSGWPPAEVNKPAAAPSESKTTPHQPPPTSSKQAAPAAQATPDQRGNAPARPPPPLEASPKEVANWTAKPTSESRSSIDQVKAIAAKISAARRLARKLTEERAEAVALGDGGAEEDDLCALAPALCNRGPCTCASAPPHLATWLCRRMPARLVREHGAENDQRACNAECWPIINISSLLSPVSVIYASTER
jgi:hypothetical protein